jgi:hypothetical protein
MLNLLRPLSASSNVNAIIEKLRHAAGNSTRAVRVIPDGRVPVGEIWIETGVGRVRVTDIPKGT